MRALLGLAAGGLLLASGVHAQSAAPWQEERSGTSETLRGVAYGMSRFVAVGDGGTIVSAVNGGAWARRESGTTRGLRAITYGAGVFVAVGDEGTVLVSFEGETWEATTAGRQRLNGVAYGNERFLAVGEKGAAFASRDGRTWTECDSGATDSSLRAVAFAVNPSPTPKFVIVGDRGTMLSTPDGGIFFNYGYKSSAYTTFPAPLELNGVAGLPAPAGSDASSFVAAGEAGFITLAVEDGLADVGYEGWSPWLPVSAPTDRRWRAVAGDYARDEFVFVGDAGALSTCRRFRFAYNLSHGPYEASPVNADWQAVACGPTQTVAVGTGGALISRAEPAQPASEFRPLIDQGPRYKNVEEGAPATFAVTTFRPSNALSFQWYFVPHGGASARLIAGATTPTFTVDEVGPGDLGHYAVVVSDGTTSETSPLAQLVLRLRASEPGFSNLSVRAHTVAGAGTLIAGVSLVGPATRSVMLRAVGPGLAPFGIADGLGNPVLSVFDQRGQRIDRRQGHFNYANNRWPYGAFPLAQDSADAVAFVGIDGPVTLTAQVTAADGASGVVLLEAYGDGFVNLSARGVVGPVRRLIAGVVVKLQPQPVLIRGIGPGLRAYGVGTAVTDPLIRVYDPDGRLTAENDNWPAGTSEGALLEQAAAKTGAFPLVRGSKDAALLLRFAPGEYTVEIVDPRNPEGIGMIEIYAVP